MISDIETDISLHLLSWYQIIIWSEQFIKIKFNVAVIKKIWYILTFSIYFVNLRTVNVKNKKKCDVLCTSYCCIQLPHHYFCKKNTVVQLKLQLQRNSWCQQRGRYLSRWKRALNFIREIDNVYKIMITCVECVKFRVAIPKGERSKQVNETAVLTNMTCK